MITFDGVTKSYSTSSRPALDDVSVHIDKGEFVFLVGPSGAGKSTFIKLLSHETVPDEGKVFVDGIEVNRLKKSKIPYLRRKLGIVFQDFRLLPNKTAFENVAFALEVMEVSRTEIKQKVHNALELVNLTAKANQLPANLSGGEQQRVAIARALITKPAIILADEPTGNLDSKTSADVLGLLKHTSGEFNQTIVMITHNNEIAQLADRIVRIEDGKIVG